MNKKLIGLIGIAVVIVIVLVGAWNSNQGNDSSEEETTNEDNSNQSNGENVELLSEYNTDPYFENITVEIIEYTSKNVVYKVTNNSNVCYDWLCGRTYFECEPLPNRKPVPDEDKYENKYSYSNPFNFHNIPAYSTTYFYRDALGEEMSSDKGGDFDGRAYYSFDFINDAYVCVIETKSTPVGGSTVSSELIQDAGESIFFDRTTYNKETGQLGTLINQSNRNIQIIGFALFSDGTICDITNCHPDLNGGNYLDGYVPANGVVLKTEYKTFDLNSIFTNPIDLEVESEYYEIYLNAWFIDEIPLD